MKKLFFLFSVTLMFFVSKTSLAQIIDTPIEHYVFAHDEKMFLLKGRVIGLNLENLNGAIISNIRTDEKATTNTKGFYQLNAAKSDTISFEFANHSKEIRTIKYPDEKLNVILILRQADGINSSSTAYRKAIKADNELYRILEKDAKLEGKWNY
jgi:hypothetical protein